MAGYEEIVSLADIEAARERIADAVFHTPLDLSSTFADLTGAAEFRLKLDNMQRTGAYKVRGAFNKMSQLPADVVEKGVIASSAGNHAQGVAYAARELGIDATIVMPGITPAAKIEATRGYGAEVVVAGEIYEEAYRHALALAEERGLEFVHPFNDPDIIAGQGTIGLEVLDDFPEVDTMVVAIGGGGLISGIATALKSHDPDIRVIGAQTEGCAHVNRSLDRGSIYERDGIDTIAEGIAASRMEANTFELVRERVDEVVEVTDAEVTEAVALLAERAKTVAEAAGAVPTAALLSGAVDATDGHVVSLVSGGNVDLANHADFTRMGLERLGRYRRIRLALRGWPGSLGVVADAIEDAGATLRGVDHEERTPHEAPNRHVVRLGVEGTGTDHLDDVASALDGHDDVAVLDAGR